MAPGGRTEAIRRFQQDARGCVRCRAEGLLHRHPDGRSSYPLFHQGSSCRAGVLAVFEAPNLADTFDPDKGRLTFDGETDPSGRFTWSLFASAGLGEDDFLCTNTVLCLPARKNGKHPITAGQRRQCQPWLERLIDDVSPGLVITFGGEALAALGRIERHGLKLKDGVGRLHDWHGRRLLPLYHPGALGRATRGEALQRADFKAIKGYLREVGFPPRT